MCPANYAGAEFDLTILTDATTSHKRMRKMTQKLAPPTSDATTADVGLQQKTVD